VGGTRNGSRYHRESGRTEMVGTISLTTRTISPTYVQVWSLATQVTVTISQRKTNKHTSTTTRFRRNTYFLRIHTVQ
jgi:hypothetical protein